MADKSNQTEKPTHQRLEKARKEGRFASSKEFVSAFQFFTFVYLLSGWTSGWFNEARQAFRMLLEQAFHPGFGTPELLQIAQVLADSFLWPALRAGGVIVLVSVAAHLLITRFGFSLQRLAFNPQRINPLNKLKEMPKQGFPAVLQACAMLVVFSGVIYGIARDSMPLFFFLPLARPETGIRLVGQTLLGMLWKSVMLFVVFGALDLFRQFRRHANDMKMSKQEIKDEYKQNEGSPQIKQAIRRMQRSMRRKRMMSEVPTATAVIVNPTHYAVAIRYKHDEMATPVVVAKGKNYLALRIRKIATENQIPLVENKPLAQALYKSVEVGQEIPPELYRAVAEILAYIYQLMNSNSGARR